MPHKQKCTQKLHKFTKALPVTFRITANTNKNLPKKLCKFTRALLVIFRMSATGTGTGTAPVTILDTKVRAG